jgi:hypothetical protein
VGRFLTNQEGKLLEKELRLERYARFSDKPSRIHFFKYE